MGRRGPGPGWPSLPHGGRLDQRHRRHVQDEGEAQVESEERRPHRAEGLAAALRQPGRLEARPERHEAGGADGRDEVERGDGREAQPARSEQQVDQAQLHRCPTHPTRGAAPSEARTSSSLGRCEQQSLGGVHLRTRWRSAAARRRALTGGSARRTRRRSRTRRGARRSRAGVTAARARSRARRAASRRACLP